MAPALFPDLSLIYDGLGVFVLQHFSVKDLVKEENAKGKNKKGKKAATAPSDTFEPDLHDPRFEAMYQSHHFGLDPSDSRFKKTKVMKSFVEERQRLQAEKRADEETKISGKVKTGHSSKEKKGKTSELSVLVDSVGVSSSSSSSSFFLFSYFL